jgi:hypothetical protein
MYPTSNRAFSAPFRRALDVEIRRARRRLDAIDQRIERAQPASKDMLTDQRERWERYVRSLQRRARR